MSRQLARIIALSLTLVAACAAVPAFAADRGPVPNDCYAFGRQLQGMSETEAIEAIVASATIPALPPVAVTIDGRTWTFRPASVLVVDAAQMLASAYATETAPGTVIAPAFRVRSAGVRDWVSTRAAKVDVAPRNAAYVYVKRGVKVDKGAAGRRLDRAATAADLRSRVASMLASSESTLTTQTAMYGTVTAPQKIRTKDLGKAVGVDLSERRIRLFDGGKLVKKYRCAIGTRSHPTPTGTFKVTGKVKWPTWRNPGSAWAANMPAVIGPSVSNPLGTRALYLNAPGIRIHGTTKRYSIGSAASHGCVRMLREDVEALYPLVPVGTRVHIVK